MHPPLCPEGFLPDAVARALCFPHQPSGRVSKRACMGSTQETPAISNPDASRPACQRGTGKDGADCGEDNRPIEGIAASWVRWVGHKTFRAG